MPWAARGRRRYFYRSQRLPDGRVGKIYCGGGELGEQAEKADAEARAKREADRTEARRLRDAFEPLDKLAAAMEDGLDVLVKSILNVGGLHQHKGTWRKRRTGLEASSRSRKEG